MILCRSKASVEEDIKRLKEQGRWRSSWEYEREVNHTHARMSSPDREHVRQELEIAAELAADLRDSYPDRRFVIAHIPCYAVSFYQPTDGAPTSGIQTAPQTATAWGPLKQGEAWCQTCQCNCKYRILPTPDPEFPQVAWGRCEVCENDVMISDCEIFSLVEIASC